MLSLYRTSNKQYLALSARAFAGFKPSFPSQAHAADGIYSSTVVVRVCDAAMWLLVDSCCKYFVQTKGCVEVLFGGQFV